MEQKPLTTAQHREILDYVLENTLEQKDYWDVREFFCINNKVFPTKDEYFLIMALNKLYHDGYIDFVHIAGKKGQFIQGEQAGEGMSIRRNFNGHIFLSKGGYVGEELQQRTREAKENAYNARLEAYSLRLANWTERLTWGTWAVAAGAVGLVIWEIWHSYH